MSPYVSKWLRRILFGLVFLSLPLAWGLLPRESEPVHPVLRAKMQLRRLHFALRSFAAQNGDRLPETLAALEPEFLQEGFLENLRFRGPEPNSRYDWLYYPAPKLSSLPSDYILIAAPSVMSFTKWSDVRRWGKVRLAMHPNGTVSDIKEPEFKKRIDAQTSAKGGK